MKQIIFIPWVREGAAAALGPVIDGQTDIELILNNAPLKPLRLSLLGPQHVRGFAPRAVIRTEPAPGTQDFTPNLFPFVEFDQPSFPWLFTPEASDGQGRLRPWIALVVVRPRPGVDFVPGDSRQGARLTVPTSAELPDLTESWAWAHAQVAGGRDPVQLRPSLTATAPDSLSRLICPRRLLPHTDYLACIVPAFAGGVTAAGLSATSRDPNADAWSSVNTDIQLPVYYHWHFRTGEAGDFESLASALSGTATPPQAVGAGELDLDGSGLNVPDGEPTRVPLGGALRPVHSPETPDAPRSPPSWASHQLASLLGQAHPTTVRVPLYGGLQTSTGQLPQNGWLRDLNTNPANRAAAGLGAQYVRDHQEELLEKAQAQAGQIQEANSLAARSTAAVGIQHSVWDHRLKTMAQLDPAALAQMAAPARLPSGQLASGMDQETHQDPPAALLSVAARRMLRPRGPIARANDTKPLRDRLAAVNPEDLLAKLDPHPTHTRRLGDRVLLGAGQSTGPGGLTSFPVRFAEAAVHALTTMGTDHLLPAIGQLPPDTVALLEPNTAFIAAFMAGLNHEMSREFLWREFPADLSGTYFRVFWDKRGQAPTNATIEDLADIPPIREWDLSESLEQVVPSTGKCLVLAVRSRLLERYPHLHVYAVRARHAAVTGVAGKFLREPEDETDSANVKYPLFSDTLGAGTGYYGFDLSPAHARGDDDGLGWFMVFQEQPTELRFGLDVADPEQFGDPPPLLAGDRPSLLSTSLGWGHLVSKDAFQSLEHAPVKRARPAGWQSPEDPDAPSWRFTDQPEDVAWDGGSADFALLTRQAPFRIALHASRLIHTKGRS